MISEIVPDDPELPIEGTTQVSLPVERMWDAFADVPRWRNWNPCIAWARVGGGELKEGATLYLAFRPIRRGYLYRLPGVAKIVDCDPQRKVTWEADVAGFHARHSYLFEPIGPDSSRFGSWEVAEGRTYRLMRGFWLAHFRFVRDQSLVGARALGER